MSCCFCSCLLSWGSCSSSFEQASGRAREVYCCSQENEPLAVGSVSKSNKCTQEGMSALKEINGAWSFEAFMVCWDYVGGFSVFDSCTCFSHDTDAGFWHCSWQLPSTQLEMLVISLLYTMLSHVQFSATTHNNCLDVSNSSATEGNTNGCNCHQSYATLSWTLNQQICNRKIEVPIKKSNKKHPSKMIELGNL